MSICGLFSELTLWKSNRSLLFSKKRALSSHHLDKKYLAFAFIHECMSYKFRKAEQICINVSWIYHGDYSGTAFKDPKETNLLYILKIICVILNQTKYLLVSTEH